MTTSAALRLGGLRKVYGDVVALEGLDLDVAAGECVALVGHNGSGKTTAVRLAAGQLQPTAGTVTVSGTVLTRGFALFPFRDRRSLSALVAAGSRSIACSVIFALPISR